MGHGAVGEHGDNGRAVASASFCDQTAATEAFVVGVRRQNKDRPPAGDLVQIREGQSRHPLQDRTRSGQARQARIRPAEQAGSRWLRANNGSPLQKTKEWDGHRFCS
jgi:hypothetical protein